MKKIVITGAAGHLGRKLFDSLEHSGEYDVLGLDIEPADHPGIHIADFTIDGDWVEYLKNADTIVHLAGDREPSATWASAISNNMDATMTLYHHAVEMGVSRVVFASSNWLHGGRRFGKEPLTSKLSPVPVNAYGMSKLFCERTGAYFADRHGLSVICLRIGWTQWTHDNAPGEHMAMGRWGQEMWLSDRDFLSGMQAAIEANSVQFAILNLMSNNPGMRWDISETRDIIGFQAKDGSRAQITAASRLKAILKRMFTFSIPRAFENKFPEW